MNQTSILITGCSSGIGLAAATALKARGYQVFAAARKPEDVAKLRAQGFDSVLIDVTDPASMHKALQEILQKTGGTLDALFNNAGYLQAGAIDDLNPDLNRAQFETNVYGPMELIRQVLPIMRAQGHGRIIQNSSILGVITMPYYGAYNASKFALEGFTHTLRQELRGSAIHVSLINPGPVTSELRGSAHKLYQQTIAPLETVHQEQYKRLETSYFQPKKRDNFFMQTPDAVVKKLIHALESQRPKVHYFVGIPAQVLAFLHRILPDRAFDWLLSKAN